MRIESPLLLVSVSFFNSFSCPYLFMVLPGPGVQPLAAAPCPWAEHSVLGRAGACRPSLSRVEPEPRAPAHLVRAGP